MKLDTTLRSHRVSAGSLKRATWCLTRAAPLIGKIEIRGINAPAEHRAVAEILKVHLPALIAVAEAAGEHVANFKPDSRAFMR